MKFSIVVSSYNRAEMLVECIKSVHAQTYENYELIVVDDGSTDGTHEAIKPFLNDRTRFIALGSNHGSATLARNTGIEAMTGDALIIWDCDDLLYPNALSVLSRGHVEHPDAVFVCALTDWDYGGTIRNTPNPGESRILSYIDWYCGKRPKEAELISVKKEAISDTRFKSRNIDFMFYNEILGRTRGKVHFVSECTGRIRLESDALSLTIKRRKSSSALSKQRAPFIADFLDSYGAIYKEHCTSAYASYAYGASVGLLLLGNYSRARRFAKEAFTFDSNIRSRLYYVFTMLPFSSPLLSLAFTVKEVLQKVK